MIAHLRGILDLSAEMNEIRVAADIRTSATKKVLMRLAIISERKRWELGPFWISHGRNWE